MAAALGWPALLVVGGVMDVDVRLLGAAAGFAVANAAVGLLVHQGLLLAVRMCRRRREAGKDDHIRQFLGSEPAVR